MIHRATLQRNDIRLIIPRYFAAVKELPWCAPKSNNSDKKNNGLFNQIRPHNGNIQCESSCNRPNVHKDEYPTKQIQSFKFGVVAAMSQDRIIGVNGKIPWTIPEDRMHFERLTSGKNLIIGRKTFYERGKEDFSHIAHCKNVIVVSSTMDQNEVKDKMEPTIHVVPSFDTALQLAINLLQGCSAEYSKGNKDANEIHCWIGGGQRIYEAAIRHPMAEEMHLTFVNTLTKRDDLDPHLGGNNFSFFPPKYRYDNVFEENKTLRRKGKHFQPELSYSFHVFKRKKRNVDEK